MAQSRGPVPLMLNPWWVRLDPGWVRSRTPSLGRAAVNLVMHGISMPILHAAWASMYRWGTCLPPLQQPNSGSMYKCPAAGSIADVNGPLGAGCSPFAGCRTAASAQQLIAVQFSWHISLQAAHPDRQCWAHSTATGWLSLKVGSMATCQPQILPHVLWHGHS